MLPRGNGKTTLAAALAVHHLLSVERPAVVVGAGSREQARVCFEAARELAEHHEKVDQSRVEMMRGYAETTGCRRQFLLGYFGEQLDEPCGNCDTCSAGTAYEDDGPSDDTPFPAATPVEHSEWGPGIVMRVEDDRLVVLFEEVGYKTLGLAAVTEHGLLRART